MLCRSSKLGFWAALAGFALSIAAVPAHADAPKKGKDKAAAEKAPADAPTTASPIPLLPDGVKWGMSRTDLEKLVDKFIDADAKADYKAAGSSGSKIKDVDARISRQKQAFKSSWNELTNGPTGLDSNPIAPEFSKGNNEALMSHHRGPGVKIWFFFINGRLWKTYEEVSFVKGGLYGETMQEAAAKLIEQVGGTVPRQTAANPDKGAFYDVFDWVDKDGTHMRVWDRSGVLALVREERSTANGIGAMRTNKGGTKDTMDPQVAAILRGNDDKKDEPKKDDAKKDDGKKKK
jgi:hypothetical protein